MKCSFRAYALSLVGLLAASVAHAQSSLSESLEVVRAQLARQGQLNYSSVTHDSADNQTWSSQFTVEASKVTVDVETCTLHFHWHTTVNGKQAADLDAGFNLRTATEINMVSMAEDMTRNAIAAGHPTWGISTQPQIWRNSEAARERGGNALVPRSHHEADRGQCPEGGHEIVPLGSCFSGERSEGSRRWARRRRRPRQRQVRAPLRTT